MRRVEDWEQRLFAAIASELHKPHAYGDNDCAVFAAGCVQAMTGEDLLRDYRGRYTTEIGAKRLLTKENARSLAEMVGRYLMEIDPAEAKRGDVITSEAEFGEFIAVVQGSTAVAPGQNGVVHVPLEQAQRAFRVG